MSNTLDPQDKRQPYLKVSLLLHGLLLLFVLGEIVWRPSSFVSNRNHEQQKNSIQAVTVSEAAVAKTLQKIKKKQEDALERRQLQKRQLAKLEAKTKAMERIREAEAQQLRSLHIKRKQAEAQRKQEEREHENKLAQLKKMQQEEASKIDSLKRRAAEQIATLQKRQSELERAKKQAQPPAQELSSQEITLINRYSALIKQSIERQWIIPKQANKQLTCHLLIRLAPGGSVLGVSIIQTSGDQALDRSAVAAVYKSSPLPVPSQAEIFDKFRELRLTVRPEGYLNT